MDINLEKTTEFACRDYTQYVANLKNRKEILNMTGKFQKRNAEQKGVRKEYELEQKLIKGIVNEIQVSGGGPLE